MGIGSIVSSLLPGLHVAGASITPLFAKDIADAFFNEVSRLIEKGAAAFVGAVLGAAVRQTTSVSVAEGNSWFAGVAALMLPVVKFVVAPLLMVATLMAVLRQDMRRLARAWAVGLPVCALGGYAALKLSDAGLAATDALSRLVLKDVAPEMKADFVRALTAGLSSGPAGPVGVLLSIVVVSGGLLIWLELSLRAVAVELAVFFMPLALAGVVWPATAHWARRLAEVLAGLLLVKPVVVGALCLGTAALQGGHGGLGAVVGGAAILLLAGFSPVVLLKMVPIVEVSSVAHLHDLSHRSVQALEHAGQRALATTAGAGAPGLLATGSVEGARSADVLLAQVSGLTATSGEPTGSAGHPLGPARPPGEGEGARPANRAPAPGLPWPAGGSAGEGAGGEGGRG